MKTAKTKPLDNPVEVLYWTLTQGQRHRLADRLGLCADTDRDSPEVERSQAWLKRARARGSFGQLVRIADTMHRSDLRHIEETINRFGYRRAHQEADAREAELMAELEEYRQRHYQWLAYAQ